jgi:hypothetical protein
VTVDLSPTQVLAVVGVLLALVMVGRSGTRRGRRAAYAPHAAAQIALLAGYVLGTAAVIVGIQWVAITYAPGSTLLWVALAVPALITSYVATRALAMTSGDLYYRRGDRR